MPKYKISIIKEEIITAKNEEEAEEKFLSNLYDGNNDPSSSLLENIKVTEQNN